METDLNRIVNVVSHIGLQMCLPRKSFILQTIDRYICIKAFDEVEKGICVWAGQDVDTGNYFIDEDRFKNLQIGLSLFLDHFENFTFPDFESFRCMKKQQKENLELKYFADLWKK